LSYGDVAGRYTWAWRRWPREAA